MLRVALSHLILDCPGLQCSANPAAENRSGWLGWMSDALQLIEHVRLRTAGPQTFLDHIPLLPPRAEGHVRNTDRGKWRNGEDVGECVVTLRGPWQVVADVCVMFYLLSHHCEASLVILRNSCRETLPLSSLSTSIPSSLTSHSPSSVRWYLAKHTSLELHFAQTTKIFKLNTQLFSLLSVPAYALC